MTVVMSGLMLGLGLTNEITVARQVRHVAGRKASPTTPGLTSSSSSTTELTKIILEAGSVELALGLFGFSLAAGIGDHLELLLSGTSLITPGLSSLVCLFLSTSRFLKHFQPELG